MHKALLVTFLTIFSFTINESKVVETRKVFKKVGVFNYMTLTLDSTEELLYVGIQEAILTFDANNLELKEEAPKYLKPTWNRKGEEEQYEVLGDFFTKIIWEAPAEIKEECVHKGKSAQTECFNFIRVLQIYNSSHMYTCGTYAFKPQCAYINLDTFSLDMQSIESGKGKCPYDPDYGYTGLVVDGELYSATFNNFLGTEAVILRNSKLYNIRTEDIWFSAPHFVGSAFIPESKDSDTGDDNKIYFFFSERAFEYDWETEQVVARVARVCQGDMGGNRILEKRWSTFLKVRLTCAIPRQQLHFNRMQAVFTLHGDDWRDTSFFVIFKARWGDMDFSAVCQYQLKNVQHAFEKGPFKEYNDQSQKWGQYWGDIPSPRPGSCVNNAARKNGIVSSLDMPHPPHIFIKTHQLMDEVVMPEGNQPLLTTKFINFTQLVVERVKSLDQTLCTVLYIGTGSGWIYKAVILSSGVYLIDKWDIFTYTEPVISLILSPVKKVLFAGTVHEVVQLPVAVCNKYLSCTDCVASRDPYCAWSKDENSCVRIDTYTGTSELLQDLGPDPEICVSMRAGRPDPQ